MPRLLSITRISLQWLAVIIHLSPAPLGHAYKSPLPFLEHRGRYFDEKCPVKSPCFCDGLAVRNSIKKIVCGDVGYDFPRFTSSYDLFESLTLMYTGLNGIPDFAFARVKVMNIDLQGNNFGRNINVHAFDGVCRYLMSLNLAWSNITFLPAKVFRGMIDLRNITLAENRLTRLAPALFQDMRSVIKLSLSGNPLKTLPSSLFRFQTNLQNLDLGYCQLEYISGIFSGLWNLRRLDLRGNELQRIKTAVFEDLWSLGTLLLSHNPIKRLQAGAFSGLGNLQRLELKESLLEYLEPGVFSDTRRLGTLELGDNRLLSIGDGVLTIPTLEWLALDGNDLHFLPREVGNMPVLSYLDLSYNRLRLLDRCIFKDLHNLKFLNLRQNPWWCTCSLFWVRTLQMRLISQWQKDRMIPFVPGECARPENLHGVGISNWLDIDCLKGIHFMYNCT